MSEPDPAYLQLYRDYSQAIRRYENAIRDRRRVRAQISAKRSRQPPIRRPVGSPSHFRIPRAHAATPPPAARKFEHRIYMGDILGWVKFSTTTSLTPGDDPTANFDVDALHDRTSLKLYWNAKNHYLKCKRAFFDYARRQNIELHRERAKQAVSHAANLQYLGAETDESFIEEARKEVEAACQNAWKLYRSSPSPKSIESLTILLENFADAQFLGLEASITTTMDAEVYRLVNSGVLHRGQ